MAEGFIHYHGSGKMDVCSAGLEPKGVHPIAVQVMAEVGIDISAHTSDPVTKYLAQKFDYVITVCDNAAERCPVFPGSVSSLHWPFVDPAAATGTDQEILAEFRKVRDQIDVRVRHWLASLGRHAES